MSENPPPPADSEEGAGRPSRETVVLLAVLVEGGLLVLAAVLGWAFDHPPLGELIWNGADALRGVACAAPMLLVFLAFQRWPVGPLRRLQRFAEEVVRPLLEPCSVIDLLGISALAGLGEEVLFRGVMLGTLEAWIGWVGAFILTSVLFGLLHAVTLTYTLLATLAGLYLGIICRWSSPPNILIAVVAHALYDFVALLWLLRSSGSAAAPAPNADKGPEHEP
jgi:membrane protease YdiL (CAAX protease family)